MVSIVAFDGEIVPIPDYEIDGIRRLVESDLQFDPCPLIREGMMVEVVHGPLKGVVGRLLRKGAHARLVLAVDLIGQAVSVEVDAADVRGILTSGPFRVAMTTMKIGSIDLAPPFALAPMAGMTDTAFRRLVKRKGGCGLVVTEMVSSEGLVRGIDRTLEYAEYTEEERPVSIQIFGGDPEKMAAAAQIVEGMGADIVDVNMGCPVPKIAKHNAGCSLMREPEHAATVVRAMARAVKIPVTVKMRAGWDADAVNAPDLARRMEDAGAAAVAVHGRTAAQSYSGVSDWDLIARVAAGVGIPVFGSGDCVEADQVVERLRARTSAACSSGAARCGTRGSSSRRRILRPGATRARSRCRSAGSSCSTTSTCCSRSGCTRRRASATSRRGSTRAEAHGPARGHDRWVINKLRALNSWYTKGLDNGSHLRVAINAADSIPHLRAIVEDFFFGAVAAAAVPEIRSPSATARPRVEVVGERRSADAVKWTPSARGPGARGTTSSPAMSSNSMMTANA